MQPTDKQISAAHDAWERTVQEWQAREVVPGNDRLRVWVVERRPDQTFDPNKHYADGIAFHKFEGSDADRQARFFLRDKCIRAALSAALEDR